MKDFQDLTDPGINKAALRALDLTRAYAARDRAAIIEHLEPDHLAHTGASVHVIGQSTPFDLDTVTRS
ncbi:hypothetical protein D9753_00605 [Streptomyces dangxiongensis]|uniref:Uncharacterized protein n=1 Tax=Streptomyces dangxiongensis TaxID=1442032 RepID=A0A3G2JB44_9ACTN|nr:hypothetical protein [Streptomyces dangxiongensis]AYN37742.1 hypothetical protein D9753_00605 [Streptomyces dangxiongensis]